MLNIEIKKIDIKFQLWENKKSRRNGNSNGLILVMTVEVTTKIFCKDCSNIRPRSSNFLDESEAFFMATKPYPGFDRLSAYAQTWATHHRRLYPSTWFVVAVALSHGAVAGAAGLHFAAAAHATTLSHQSRQYRLDRSWRAWIWRLACAVPQCRSRSQAAPTATAFIGATAKARPTDAWVAFQNSG